MFTLKRTLAGLVALFVPVSAQADILFELDPSQSSVSVGVSLLGVDFVQQAPGSLITNYSGSIDANLSDPLSPATSITFNSASVVAGNNGQWQPDSAGLLSGDLGFSPTDGNYGLFAPTLLGQMVYIAIHDIQLSMSGDQASQTFSFVDGLSDINAGAFGNLFLSLGGNNATNTQVPTYAPNGDGSGVITLPIDIDFVATVDVGPPFGEVPVNVNFDGQLVAASVPEPSSFLFLGLIAVVGSGGAIYKRVCRKS